MTSAKKWSAKRDLYELLRELNIPFNLFNQKQSNIKLFNYLNKYSNDNDDQWEATKQNILQMEQIRKTWRLIFDQCTKDLDILLIFDQCTKDLDILYEKSSINHNYIEESLSYYKSLQKQQQQEEVVEDIIDDSHEKYVKMESDIDTATAYLKQSIIKPTYNSNLTEYNNYKQANESVNNSRDRIINFLLQDKQQQEDNFIIFIYRHILCLYQIKRLDELAVKLIKLNYLADIYKLFHSFESSGPEEEEEEEEDSSDDDQSDKNEEVSTPSSE
ncbi:uncharacterized protein J8A68_002649 [[Candida] subhashii]|uniref:Uncharacterized protein n=1 Tax=[Candida] subhashii TaxID=561895 RepID=A0A8J5QKU5_9ASCO|nr:uncharacterized protein J8A68_002649 [[Candida] subhashii]KAG7663789.1 hypothetical protein J8A68_002649 [[Candida] subhashii]